MHMADALISPIVGGTLLAASTGLTARASKKLQTELDEHKIPLMGVMGAFVFAVQMVNFTIPATGSSGHLGGGLMLAILLGPYAGFLTMASVLLIQALFFGDGGLLAYGCNVFNLGFYTCFIAYPFIFKPLTQRGYTPKRLFSATLAAAVVGLQLGSFSVVLETLLSGKTELPFTNFLLLMQPVHLAIGLVEGLVTAAVVTFIWRAKPELLNPSADVNASGSMSLKGLLLILGTAAVLIGGGLSLWASENPDGLEWAMIQTAGTSELEANNPVHEALAKTQAKTAVLPDYGFKSGGSDAATSISGLVGGGLTLALALGLGWLIRLRKAAAKQTQEKKE